MHQGTAFILGLTLVGMCQAKPYVSQAHGFSADFPGPVDVSKEKDPPGFAYTWEKGREDRFIVAVVKDGHKMTRYQAYQRLILPMVKDLAVTRRETTIQGLPALEVSGLDNSGVPVVMVVVPHGETCYMAGAASFDLARQRQFTQSFRLLHP